MKNTKIVCTIGPACDTEVKLKQLIKNGMNVARLNFSHNVQSYHKKVLERIRKISKIEKKSIGIILDLQGPRIRLGILPKEGLKLKKGQIIVLTTKKEIFEDNIVPVTYQKMHQDVKKGERILIADGLMELVVEKISQSEIYCKVRVGGIIFSNKGINLPDTKVQIPAFSAKDKGDVAFGVKNEVDFIALSFVRTVEDVYQLKALIKKAEKDQKINHKFPIKVLVKIERTEAIHNLDKILEATDGVMVARGDLGIELPPEDVPLLQKMIIEKCLKMSKPVIVATQMLESMIDNPRPTRAEVSDVANAVIDHTDATMLSGETASGKYSQKAVAMMRDIIIKTEQSAYDNLVVRDKVNKYGATDQAMARAARVLVDRTKAKCILAISYNGDIARVLSRYRPELPIYCATFSDRVVQQLDLSWGVYGFKIDVFKKQNIDINLALNFLKKNKIVKKKDKIIIVNRLPIKNSDRINQVELIEI